MGKSCVVFILRVLALSCLVSLAVGQGNWWDDIFDHDTTSTSTETPSQLTPLGSEPLPKTMDCGCVSTQEYNPVCGTDGVTYSNEGMLRCAQNCGRSVAVRYYGACQA